MKSQFTLEDSHDLIRMRQVWSVVLVRLREEAGNASFEKFLRPLEPLTMVNGILTVAAPGQFVAEWVKNRYLDHLQRIVSDEYGSHIVVEILTEPRERQITSTGAPIGYAKAATADTNGFRPHSKFSFETFVVGQSNRLAVAGAKAVAAEPGAKYNPLFIYGSSGLGKTHLLHSIAQEVIKHGPEITLAYVSAQQFAEEFIAALQNNRIEQFRRQQRNVGMWLVDDIQFIAGKDKTQEEIFHTFNYLHSLGKQIVLTSDRPPRDLFLMDERLRSRFEAGLVADVQMPDTETRCAILLSKAKQENIELGLDIAMLMAESVPGNIRILEGALTKLCAQASVCNLPLSMALATEMVEQYYRTGILAKPGFGQIVDAVSKHYKISSDEIKGTSRKAPLVHARHIAIFITREITHDSWKHIGSLFGDRDHTSMMHAYTKISEMMNADKDLSASIKMLIRNLYPES